MCENCTAHRNAIRLELIELLENTPDSRLMEKVNGHVDSVVKEIVNKRIKPTLERHPEMTMPPMVEVREAVKDCLIASVLALGAAAMAATTPSYTDEGGEPRSVVLGLWAGSVLEGEVEIFATDSAVLDNALRSLLGMGDN